MLPSVLTAFVRKFPALWWIVHPVRLHHQRAVSGIQFVSLTEEPFALELPPGIPPVPPALETSPPGSIPFASIAKTKNLVLIDARTETEFREDHLPGAINVPVLLEHQRAKVGKIYCSGNKLEARLLGANFVCTNIANSLENSPLSHIFDESKSKTKETTPPFLLVYCWRGGQRSQALTTVLNEIGWPGGVGCLAGGYRSWRRLLLRQLEAWPQFAMPSPLWVLTSLTGCGKTLLLKELSKAGEQVLDLESMADHKGSLFGVNNSNSVGGPSQKVFEGRLHAALKSIPPYSPKIWTECESRNIGPRCHLNTGFWKRLRGIEAKNTLRIWLDVPEDARVAWILEDYSEWLSDSERLDYALKTLSGYHGKKVLDHWRQLVSKADFSGLVVSLLRTHYDPLYKKSRGPILTEFSQAGLLCRVEVPEVTRLVIRKKIIPLLLDISSTSALHDDRHRPAPLF